MTKLTAVLIVGFSSSSCSNCRRQTLPGWETHESNTGYGTGSAGCGAEFVSITYDGPLTEEVRERLAEMRPDLPISDRLRSPYQAPEMSDD